MVTQRIHRESAQPGQETSLVRIETANVPHRREPGFLHDFVGLIPSSARSPKDVAVQIVESFVIPRLPGAFIAA